MQSKDRISTTDKQLLVMDLGGQTERHTRPGPFHFLARVLLDKEQGIELRAINVGWRASIPGGSVHSSSIKSAIDFRIA